VLKHSSFIVFSL